MKDYVESVEAQGVLGGAITPDFDPHHKLCLGSLAYLKAIETDQDFLANGTFWDRVHRCLYSAARVQTAKRSTLVPLLDQLDETGSILAKCVATFVAPSPIFGFHLVSLLETGHWVPSHPMIEQTLFGATFLSLVVRYGIVEYIEAKANRLCLVQHFCYGVWPLLLDAVHVDSSGKIGPQNEAPRLEVIDCLLKKGADPNYPLPTGAKGKTFRGATIWLYVLDYILDGNRLTGHHCLFPWSQIVDAMIQYGANVDARTIQIFKREIYMPKWRYMQPYDPNWSNFLLLKHLDEMQQPLLSKWFPWISRKKAIF